MEHSSTESLAQADPEYDRLHAEHQDHETISGDVYGVPAERRV